MRIKTLLWLSIPLILTTCVTTPNAVPLVAASRSFVVAFNVTGQDKLDAHTDNQGCNVNKKGCVAFEKGSAGTIAFYLRGPGIGKKCDSDAPKPHYVITGVELSADEVLATGKGDFTKDPPQWLRDSFPGTKADGVIFAALVSDANSLVSISNLNNHQDEETIYYQITAKACPSGPGPGTGVHVSDPMIENRWRT